MTHSAKHPTKLVMMVAVAVGLSIMGDSLMYGILPLEAENLGFTLSGVGLLLSANRLIRLLSNTWAGAVFERFGPRLPFIAATGLGFVAALVYGAGWGFVAFLLARIGWGIAWSGLRQGGYEAVWRGEAQIKGRLMGLLFGIVRLGSAISVVLGGYLRDHYGYQVSISLIAGLTALAIPVALTVRWPPMTLNGVPSNTVNASDTSLNLLWAGWRQALRYPVRRWLLTAGFINALMEGVVIATASIFLAERLGQAANLPVFIGVGTIAGTLLAIRWTANMLFGPLIGALSDRLGQAQTIVALAGTMFGALVGAIILSGIWLILSLLVAFISLAGLFITLTAASSGVATQARRPHLFVGVYTTAADGGAAIGPLLAFNLGQLTGFEALYLGIGLLLLLTVIRYWQVEQRDVARDP